jgi:hypothetical protein
MRETLQPSDNWTACPPGALQDSARKLRGRRRLKRAAPLATLAAVLLAALVFALRTPSSRQFGPPGNVDYDYGGIACSEVVPLLDDLAIGQVDADTRARIEEHLQLCPKCRAVQSSMSREAGASATNPGRFLIVPRGAQFDASVSGR